MLSVVLVGVGVHGAFLHQGHGQIAQVADVQDRQPIFQRDLVSRVQFPSFEISKERERRKREREHKGPDSTGSRSLILPRVADIKKLESRCFEREGVGTCLDAADTASSNERCFQR